MLSLALVAAAGLAVAAYKIVGGGGPNLNAIALGIGLPVSYVRSAYTWAKKQGLPLEWVLATILVESNGNPRSQGDADNRSVGLMQVNVLAHGEEMAAAGVTRAQMFEPDTNIAWGTRILADVRRGVLTALGGRRPPARLDVITRLAYKGPRTVYAAIKRGENPVDISWAPLAIKRWNEKLTRARNAEAVGRRLLTKRAPLV